MWGSVCRRVHGQCVCSQSCSGGAGVAWPWATEPVLDRTCLAVTASTSKVPQPLSRSLKDKPRQAIPLEMPSGVALSAGEAQEELWAAAQPDNIRRKAGIPRPALTPWISLPRCEQHRRGLKPSPNIWLFSGAAEHAVDTAPRLIIPAFYECFHS